MESEKVQGKEPIWNTWYLDKLLGTGSFGTVYRIKREEFGNIQYAAMKIITVPSKEEDIKKCYIEGMTESEIWEYYQSIVQEIYSEITLMTKVKGKSNIVSYEDHEIVKRIDGKIGYYIYIRMELLTGLYEHIQNNVFTPKDVVCMGIDLCQALCICEKQHIVHRDIKPENIFITPEGDFKLGDFGIAKSIEHNPKGGSIKGSYAYMAPEIYAGRQYNHKVDVYSLGIVIYTFLNNRKIPFIKEEKNTTYIKQKQAMEQRLSGEKIPLLAGVCIELAKVVDKAIQFNPNDRYESAEDFLKELKNVLPLLEEEHINREWNKTVVLTPKSNLLYLSREATIKDEVEVIKNQKAFHSPKEKKKKEQQTFITHHEKKLCKRLLFCVIVFAIVGGLLLRKDEMLAEHENGYSGTINAIVKVYENVSKTVKVEIPDLVLLSLDWSDLGIKEWEAFPHWEKIRKQLSFIDTWNVRENQLTQINPLENAVNLRSLDISYNYIRELIVLENCKKITFLNITGNPVKDISWITKLKDLQILWIGNTRIEGISDLAVLNQLQDLHLENTDITDLSPLTSCKELSQLDLTGCKKVENVNPLLSLENLHFVSLDGTKVQIKDVGKLYQHMLETTGEAYVICPNGEEYVSQ